MDPKDKKKSRYWAISNVGSVGFVANAAIFDLVNRETGRAHQLHFYGGGFSFSAGSGGGAGPNVSYTCFTTKKRLNFGDFHGCGARFTGVNAGVFFGYSHCWLTIWPGAAYLDDPIAYVSMNGWGPMLPGGNAAIHGVTVLHMGSGNPLGLVPMVLDIPLEIPPSKRLTRIRSKARETRLLGFPEDVLFDFDSAKLKPTARNYLRQAVELISARDRGRVTIEGHTDSKGKATYNKELSLRRARAVKQWFVSKRVYNASNFRVVGHGATRPLAPNQLSNGRDNPKGRQQNRRVEVVFHYNR